MKTCLPILITLATLAQLSAEEGWTNLFNGKDLTGWTASENKKSCKVQDGKIVLFGPRSHLFYTGDFNDGIFTDFELKLEVMTTPGSNSGVYFHTKYQEKGWPGKGYKHKSTTLIKTLRKREVYMQLRTTSRHQLAITNGSTTT